MQKSSMTRPPTSATWLVVLMSASVLINYVDRGNLAVVGPQFMASLGLPEDRFGLLGSAFFVTYVLAMIPAGWLSDRYGAKPVLAAGVAIWSLATLLTGYAGAFATIFAYRLLLGVGESVAFPATSKMMASQLDVGHAGTANGAIAFGYSVGPAIGVAAGTYLLTHYGWRSTFITFGGLSLLWLIPWLMVRVHEPVLAHREDPAAADAPGYREILAQRGLWGASLGHFASNYNFYFILFWLPSYLEKQRGFSPEKMGAVAVGAYIINAVSGLAAGIATDRWVKRGGSPTLAYKSLMGLNHVFSIFCMAGLVLLPERPAIACLYAYEVVLGVSAPGVFAISQILAGPTATGRWVGIQNALGNVAGIFAPYITGLMIVMGHGRYEGGFAVAALVNVLGLLGWLFILRRIEAIDWKAARRRLGAVSPG